ncbi:MAG: hypothetical protein V3T83_02680 [Acidobacteriota bacterium]
MLALLQSLREYAAKSDPLQVLLIDDPHAPEGRDRVMASRLATVGTSSPNRLLLVLTGNFHNRLRPAANRSFEPMGSHLRRQVAQDRIISLDMGHSGGSAWVCFGGQPSDCGSKKLGGSATKDEGVELLDDSDGALYSGRYYVGEIHASPPAVQSSRR